MDAVEFRLAQTGPSQCLGLQASTDILQQVYVPLNLGISPGSTLIHGIDYAVDYTWDNCSFIKTIWMERR